jgi:polyribonucleotide nucleotidyltransferase
MQKKEYCLEVAGKKLIAEFTDLAERADGSVIIKYGNAVILATAVMSKNAKEGGDFFPLTVDYEEKFYASGKILGSKFIRREGKPSDEAILSGRIIDRTIRPLFDQQIRNEVQVIITVLSIDEDAPDVLSVIGASLALATSDIPWNGPVSAIRIGKLKNVNDLVINPTYTWRENPEAEFEMVACGKDRNINMIELGAHEVSEAITLEALKTASQEIERIQEFQRKIVADIGKTKREIKKKEIPSGLVQVFESEISPKFQEYVMSNTTGDTKITELKDIFIKLIEEKFSEKTNEFLPRADELFEERVNELLHKEAIDNEKRADGRSMDQVRPLFAQAGGISPILHGSGIFYRGGTHILSALTLGGPQDAQTIDGLKENQQKRFIHHYNFPPFSTGETGRTGGTNRRMIGHGALAEKALFPIIPNKESFPYTIRIVSEALSSNGSTSMGSVCGSSLALMDAGVPIKNPVAGIASGLMMQSEKKYKILTDIQGPEDHHGDMDLKVAGTKNGITAMQMDVKITGIPLFILKEALEKAKMARLQILDVILSAIAEPRKDISPKAPKIVIVKVRTDQIGLIIGPGGKTINGIKDRTGVEGIDIDDGGVIFITGKNGDAEKAREIIITLTKEYEKRAR